MVILETPKRAISLPSPELSDTHSNSESLVIKRSVTGDTYTYIKDAGLSKLKFSWILGRIKSLELKDFLSSFADDVMIFTDWLNQRWSVNLLTNPSELIAKSRYDFEREQIDVTLEFEGFML